MEANELCKSVVDAFWQPAAHAAVKAIYDSLGLEIAKRKPRCEMSGRCCNFEEYGHRLYLTTLELATFLHDYLDRPIDELRRVVRQWDGISCPFQSGRLCTVHSIRPMGCRMFFCDVTSIQWQQEQYETLHARLKRLHETLNIPYFYVEWRSALAQLGFK